MVLKVILTKSAEVWILAKYIALLCYGDRKMKKPDKGKTQGYYLKEDSTG